MSKNQNLNPHFFRRDRDGSARIRLRFTPEEASIIEEGSGDTPLATYLHRVVVQQAKRHAQQAREKRERQLKEETADE